ncbi:endosome/lysosome-associated apoptosis and autophagy regulator family member 2-like isoform X2 [Patiria miniata]|uniref:MRH domain-containing protein n=1 Tax=Patiria miniata TaxID=46514 RepID=A0A914AZZ2_PATMI|nr:endosome/lysosome-associated apoptosis and autophagy regulator family member 2-like isoform X2 [Patiria miniata]
MAQIVRSGTSRQRPCYRRTLLGLMCFVFCISHQFVHAEPVSEEKRGKQILPTCTMEQFHYEYTECDKNGVRWRVSVPYPDTCTGGAPEPPTRAVDCNFSCGPGDYLDKADTQQCLKCQPGSFSLGGGKLFQDWSSLPEGFTVTQGEEEYTSHLMDDDEEKSCNNSMWEPKGNHIRSPGDNCISKLIYAANLMKDGYVEFTYSLATDDTILHVSVTNEKCEADKSGDRWPDETGEGTWRTYKMPLEPGMNVITWKAVGIGFTYKQNTKPDPVLIKEIKIMGVSFTSECTKAKPGTFVKDSGASDSELCPANTFSATSGAVTCTDCVATTHYSNPGATECIEKKPCTEQDYYKTHTPCDEKNQTQVMYKWIEPRMCRSDIAGAKQLPASGEIVACPPCNPGMSAFNHTTCTFCPKNMFSDGSLACKECPPNTAPVYGMNYIRWHIMPPNMDATCLSLSGFGCSDEAGWQLSDDHIHSGKGHADDVYLVLDLGLDGMQSEEGYFDGKAEELGVISFWFSLECTSDCVLFFVRDGADGSPIIEQWTGSQPKQEYRYSITKNEPVTYSWAFQKTDIQQYTHKATYNYRNDVAKIYSVTVTNTLNGGAMECKKCPRGSNVKGCIPCEAGKYIANDTNKCIPCPKDTSLRANNPYGPEACVPCGPGLMSDEGISCYSTCHVHSDGFHYELGQLAGVHSVQTGASFTARGSRFYHHFNISLCGTNKGRGGATCYENVTDVVADYEVNKVDGYICRSTIIPPAARNIGVLSAQPISLGDRLIGITRSNSLQNLNETIFLPTDEGPGDLHFFYHSAWPTMACPEGRSTIITLRCDLSASGPGSFHLPEECPSGTCDGCAFHLLWRSEHACPLCHQGDFKSIKGECVDGKQQIQYMWKTPKFCTGGNPLPDDLTQTCEMEPWYNQVPWYAQASIAAFMGCVVLLITCALYFWKRNRKLEYKYQKLVASASGELPAAETCAIEDGDNEDDVLFEDGGKKSRSFFGKFLSRPSNEKGFLLDEDDMDATPEVIEMKPAKPLTKI